ncbi:MAG: hypothetical protein HQ539_02275 [Parcubacteria group bacterium]|nr:hypothetical protein [Parcubacteria group bacterium]
MSHIDTKIQKQKGVVLIITLASLGVMLFLGSYFLSFALTGSKISATQGIGIRAYYLAESGIDEALFKLQNDVVWKTAFETEPNPGDPNCSSWSITPYIRDPALIANGSYTITVTNLGCAQAEIESKANIQLPSGSVAQRVIKMKVFKAMGSPLSDFSVFLGGPAENFVVSFVNPLNIHDGSLFSNKAIRVKNLSVVNVDNKALAGQNITVDWSSELNATSCASNICNVTCDAISDCPPATVGMPPIDFDSGGSESYIYIAQNDDCSSVRTDGKTNCVFTPAEFEQVMWDNYPALSLPSTVVVYVTGDINLRAGQDLTVNGTLLADRDINLGKDLCWTKSEPPYVRCGTSRIHVVRPGAPADNLPSGILASRKFNTGIWLGIDGEGLHIEGLVYSGDEMRFSSIGASVEIHGAIAGRKVSFSSMWAGVDIYLEPNVVMDTFKDAEYSPLITIEHWEEEY